MNLMDFMEQMDFMDLMDFMDFMEQMDFMDLMDLMDLMVFMDLMDLMYFMDLMDLMDSWIGHGFDISIPYGYGLDLDLYSCGKWITEWIWIMILIHLAPLDTSIEDDWECRFAVPRCGSISTFELPVCNEEFIDNGRVPRSFQFFPGVAKVQEFRIYTSNDIPKRTARMIHQAYKSEVDIQIQNMLDRNIMRESNSPWQFPPVILGNKVGGYVFALVIVV